MLKLVLEIIGTVAFAVSGATVGIKKKMDILGVITMGVVTAVGGGIIRDMLIGVIPPSAFTNPLYAILAICVSTIVFVPFVNQKINLDHIMWVLVDAIGLGAFTIIGVSTGVQFNNHFLAVFLGITTGVGGGVIRDVCSGKIPMIFVKHFYACPCIIGAIVCALMYKYNYYLAVASGFAVVIILRLLAAKFKWHLPKAK